MRLTSSIYHLSLGCILSSSGVLSKSSTPNPFENTKLAELQSTFEE